MSDGDKSDGGWRGASSFNRAERYDAASGSSAAAPGAMAVPLGAAAFLAAIVLALALDLPRGLAILLGLGAFALFYFNFGGKAPGAGRRVAETPGVDRAAVQAALDAAEADMKAVDALAAGKLAERGVAGALRDMTAAARRVLDEIAQDPNDLDRARKFVKVYLPSARAAVEKFAAFEATDDDLESRFRNLVREMQATAERQYAVLRQDERLDLEVEMDVLAERLKQ